jgi:hypothetical protein
MTMILMAVCDGCDRRVPAERVQSSGPAEDASLRPSVFQEPWVRLTGRYPLRWISIRTYGPDADDRWFCSSCCVVRLLSGSEREREARG